MSKVIVEIERACLQECDELRTELAEARAELALRDWKPIETAPRDGTEILVVTQMGAYWLVAFIGGAWWTDAETELLSATHWQPLPAPPSKGEVR